MADFKHTSARTGWGNKLHAAHVETPAGPNIGRRPMRTLDDQCLGAYLASLPRLQQQLIKLQRCHYTRKLYVY